MTPLERLQQLASSLPPDAVDALIAVAERMSPQTPTSNEEFAARLAQAAAEPEEPLDPETVANLRAAQAEVGENLSHEDLKRRLSL